MVNISKIETSFFFTAPRCDLRFPFPEDHVRKTVEPDAWKEKERIKYGWRLRNGGKKAESTHKDILLNKQCLFQVEYASLKNMIIRNTISMSFRRLRLF